MGLKTKLKFTIHKKRIMVCKENQDIIFNHETEYILVLRNLLLFVRRKKVKKVKPTRKGYIMGNRML